MGSQRGHPFSTTVTMTTSGMGSFLHITLFCILIASCTSPTAAATTTVPGTSTMSDIGTTSNMTSQTTSATTSPSTTTSYTSPTAAATTTVPGTSTISDIGTTSNMTSQTTSATTSPSTTTPSPDQIYCYKCDSNDVTVDNGLEAAVCRMEWTALTSNQTQSYLVACPNGFCVKYDYKVKTDNGARKETLIVRDCASDDDIASLPSKVPSRLRKLTHCQRGQKFRDTKATRCLCTTDYCNHGDDRGVSLVVLGLCSLLFLLRQR